MTPAIECHGVSVIRQGKPTLDDVTWVVHQGEQWALVGPNGAGKSTLLSVIGTTTAAVRGTVKVLGHEIGRVDLGLIRERMGYVTAHHQLEWPMSALDIVLTAYTHTLETPMRWQATPEQVAAAKKQLDAFGLLDVADTHWRGLSQGELGKTLLAKATMFSPELLLLDEPAAGLDLAAREHVLNVLETLRITNPAMTTVLVTHHLEELPPTTTHAAVMKHGKIIAQGTVEDTLTSEVLTEAFDTPIRVDYQEGRWSTRRHYS